MKTRIEVKKAGEFYLIKVSSSPLGGAEWDLRDKALKGEGFEYTGSYSDPVYVKIIKGEEEKKNTIERIKKIFYDVANYKEIIELNF